MAHDDRPAALSPAVTTTSEDRRRRRGAAHVGWGLTAAGVVVTAAMLRGFFGPGAANYDTLFALVWGRSVMRGEVPDYAVELAPTPKPAAIALGAALSPLGHAAEPAIVALGYLSIALVAVVVLAIARRSAGMAGGVVAALLVLTREPMLSFGLRAYADLAYVALLLTSLVIEMRRPRAGMPVLALLGTAGLIRPEAWLLSALYTIWVWPGRTRASRAVLLAIAAAPVLLWAGTDLVVTGDPLWSLMGTREGAQTLRRPTGLGDALVLAPRRIGEIVREPVLFAAIGGALFGALATPRKVMPLLAAIAVALLSFAVMAAAGLPILGRYLLFPASLLIVLAAIGALGWRDLASEQRLRRPWQLFAALALGLLVATAPAQAARLATLSRTLGAQREISSDLHALADSRAPAASCRGPVRVPNHRPVPALAFWLDTALARVTTQSPSPASQDTVLVAANARVTRLYALDPRDRSERASSTPRDTELIAANRSWRIYARCPGHGVPSGAPSGSVTGAERSSASSR